VTRHAVPGRTIGRNRELVTRLARAEVDEIEQKRRTTHYTGLEHAPEDATVWVPPLGTPERDALVARLRQLKADGLTHVQAAIELGLEPGQVSGLCKVHDIVSARPRKGWRKR